jgi:hypothetical protein
MEVRARTAGDDVGVHVEHARANSEPQQCAGDSDEGYNSEEVESHATEGTAFDLVARTSAFHVKRHLGSLYGEHFGPPPGCWIQCGRSVSPQSANRTCPKAQYRILSPSQLST